MAPSGSEQWFPPVGELALLNRLRQLRTMAVGRSRACLAKAGPGIVEGRGRTGRQWRSFGYLPLLKNQKFLPLHAGGHMKEMVEVVFHSCFLPTSACDLMGWALQWTDTFSYREVWVKGGDRNHDSLFEYYCLPWEGCINWLLWRPGDDGKKASPKRKVGYFSSPMDR